MPNYREQNGEVGSYNNLKVWVLNGEEFQKRLLTKGGLNTTTIYCLKEYDPYHKLLPDCMYAYMINPNDRDNLYCLGTMGNYGKVNFKKNIAACERFPIVVRKTPESTFEIDTTNYGDAPTLATIDSIFADIQKWNTKINYADYTKTVDKYLEALT